MLLLFLFLLLLHILPVFEPRCPNGKVKARDCGSYNDLECVDQESGIQAHGEASVPGEPVTTSLEAPTAPSLSSGTPWWVIVLGVFALLVTFVYCCYRSRNLPCEFGGSDGRALALSAASLTSCFRQKGPPLCLPNLWVFLAWL